LSYTPLEIEVFGESLLTTGDLDPVYIALHGAALPVPQLSRWLLAYWCCYHVGASSWLSERDGKKYWDALHRLAENVQCPAGPRWPRGRERRHFRGERSVNAVETIRARFKRPERVVEWLSVPTDYQSLRDKVSTLPLFGNWISFKIGDMLERVCGVSVDFSGADLLMFEQPRKAAVLWHNSHFGRAAEDEPAAVLAALAHLQRRFGDWEAPPGGGRKFGLQEAETILCKWKSHQNGHYPLGNDINELHHGIHEWTRSSRTAADFKAALPTPVGRLF
jgi:hypothetical protein